MEVYYFKSATFVVMSHNSSISRSSDIQEILHGIDGAATTSSTKLVDYRVPISISVQKGSLGWCKATTLLFFLLTTSNNYLLTILLGSHLDIRPTQSEVIKALWVGVRPLHYFFLLLTTSNNYLLTILHRLSEAYCPYGHLSNVPVSWDR